MVEDKLHRLNELYYEEHIGDDNTWFLLENAKNIFRYAHLEYLDENKRKEINDNWEENLQNEIEKQEKILRKNKS